MADFQTVRIPELDYGLPLATSLAPEDRIPLWLSGLDKTVYVELKDIGAVIGGGSGGGTTGPLNPVAVGKRIIFTIPASLDGTDTVSIPSLAGQDFELTLEGRPLYKRDPAAPLSTDEYEILSGGGFRVIGFTLTEGSRYALDLYELIQQNNNTTASPLFSGMLPIATNRTLSVSDLNKLYQLRGGSNALTVTLPNLTLVPDNQPLLFETAINNQKPHRIQTAAGQFIYVNGQGLTSLYLHPGENLWLAKGDDGYYVINDYAKYYSLIGKPVQSYTVDAGEVLLNGQELLRADYPRLWEKVQTFGASLVSHSLWLTESVTHNGETVLKPYRGCWSTGNGSTTFFVPDFMNAFVRGVKSTSGTDTERYLNTPGIWQNESLKAHTHDVVARASGTSGNGSLSDGSNDGQGTTVATTSAGGTETRPGNIGLLYVTKF